ncbi:hypothetical protein ASPSYDRAFT_167627 [Aspergillus sydowii CBS 593.65]|uniref:Enoyl reductase (ER) domain-containing protein n=1 Tax=Aspergillus sydowii CBS 593.65 TaxID=1036612 RepID=A0A1L9TXQ2_9EURO|nr:uncharacterized protein ASPSYDRAFT_167627 [Aspergillus sydowii CBS 593.65]OJJ64210.1 hypothetical protein ASPSYDRAFT_167627 [Aspergillus sydowii CBS 593.65]
MRAVVWQGQPQNVAVVNLPMPTIQSPTDAIVRVTAAGICGTDLHTYRGHYGSQTPPWPMGHEAMGQILEVGEAVSSLQVGDPVVVSDVAQEAEIVGEDSVIYPFGMGPDRGDLGGCQSEYLRVPYAEDNLFRLPDSFDFNSTEGLSYLFLSDIFATGWTALDFAGFEPGDTLAVFGAGPVGLLATYSAFLRGASRVYVVDSVPQRLEVAESLGGIPINFAHTDAVEQILRHEPNGVVRSVDCVGLEAVNATFHLDQGIVLRNMINVTATRGGMGAVGIYADVHESSGVPLADAIRNDVSFPLGTFFSKSLSYKAGAVNPLEVAPELSQLISSGQADPSFIISSQIGIEEAPDAYSRFDRHLETKVIIRFP